MTEIEPEGTGRGSRIVRPLLLSLAVLLLLVSLAAGGFFWSERAREQALERYRIPPPLLEHLRASAGGRVGDLLQPGEVLVCVLGAYQPANALGAALGEARGAALEHLKLPQEDGTWYLLMFSPDGISRVNLIDRTGHFGVELAAEGCHGPDTRFEMRRGHDQPGEEFVQFWIKQR